VWLTRVPFNVKKAKELVTIKEEKTWIQSENVGYKYIEKKVNYHGIDQRWLIIESEKRKQSDLPQLEKRIEAESKKIEKEFKKLFGKKSKENKEKEKEKEINLTKKMEISQINQDKISRQNGKI